MGRGGSMVATGHEDGRVTVHNSDEMTQRRLTQANLFGPAGFVSADDGEVIEFSQQAFESKPFHRTVAELGGRDVGETEHMVTETLIRGMYRYWRNVMEA
jgi:salicylate 5-hydroxylase large subunit